ncbi:MAG: cupin domain-containing protein [Actinomycetota bacterium]
MQNLPSQSAIKCDLFQLCQLTVGNQTRVLGPGEGFLFPSRVPHRFRNPGPDECVIVSANSPPV